MKIQLTQIVYRADKKGIWREKETEKREISENEYNLLTNKDTLKFFRKLGGNETIKKTYTYNGYCITYLSSTSPDRGIKIVRKFKFS